MRYLSIPTIIELLITRQINPIFADKQTNGFVRKMLDRVRELKNLEPSA